MSAGIFTRLLTRRVVLISAGTVTAGGVGTTLAGNDPIYSAKEAEIQFATSYGFVDQGKQLIKPPENWTGRLFKIRNDYPSLADIRARGGVLCNEEPYNPTLPGPDTPVYVDPKHDAPWLEIDFKKHPKKYCEHIKAYCLEGNVVNNFVLENNKQRNWYHAPWMHWSFNGREPLNGLTFERPTPAFELSNEQNRPLQTWACGFYNEIGSTVFGEIWKDKANPDWSKHVKFPKGTCVFKILMSDATKDEVFTMKGAPTLDAVIAKKFEKGKVTERDDKPTKLGLLQVDFAVVDDRAEIGWVFGTFMYNGEMKDLEPWDRLMPVGIMWGNDPELTPEALAQDKTLKPKQSWINPHADKIRKRLNGTRPSWGWNGRMNGPADNFVSACASCHSTSEHRPAGKPVSLIPTSGADPMKWFRNLRGGQPFNKDGKSADYSLQLMMGYANFLTWRNAQTAKNSFMYRTKMSVPLTAPYKEAKSLESMRLPLRASPEDMKVGVQQRKDV